MHPTHTCTYIQYIYTVKNYEIQKTVEMNSTELSCIGLSYIAAASLVTLLELTVVIVVVCARPDVQHLKKYASTMKV